MRTRNIVLVIIVCLLAGSCQKEIISTGVNVSDTFYLDNAGSSMRLLVEGNTASHIFLILIHGGPGASSYFFNTDYISQNLENNYAVVYWDQRNAGASQGNVNNTNLNLDQMTEDLKKVIQLIEKRYGPDSEVFIGGQSFGGLLISSFMTKDDYQFMIKGCIFIDGSHNYPLNDTLTRQMLLTNGQEQIALSKNTDQWQPIVSYCLSHNSDFSLEDSQQFESYAVAAETYFPEVKETVWSAYLKSIFRQNGPATSILINYLYTENSSLDEKLAVTQFSTSLYKIVSPTLLLYGKYDFVCPKGLGEDIFNRISTNEKKIAISPISGHSMMTQDPAFFCKEVNEFIEKYR